MEATKKENISYEDFTKVQIVSGTVVKTEEFPRARKPAYKIWVDFGGNIGTLQTSAQVTKLFTREELVGKQVLGCINLGERNIAGFVSQFLLLGCSDENGDISIATLDKSVPNGNLLH